MEQTVHGRRLELLFHSLRNYRLILTCFSWLTFQLKALSTWERGSYSSDSFSGQLSLAAVTRTSLPSVALWLIWVSFCTLKERGFLKPMCRKEFLIHIYRVPATFKVFRHMKVTQENGLRSWLWLTVYSWGKIIQPFLLNFHSWERKAMRYMISGTPSSTQFAMLCISPGPWEFCEKAHTAWWLPSPCIVTSIPIRASNVLGLLDAGDVNLIFHVFRVPFDILTNANGMPKR